MYEQIINSAIDFSILVMEGFLAFYLLAEMLPDTDESIQDFGYSEEDEHSSDDYHLMQMLSEKGLNMKELQSIAKENKVPCWSRMKKEELERELYNFALL